MWMGGNTLQRVNSAEVIGNGKFNRFHWMLLFWCFVIIMFDGYDLVMFGTVVPVLIEEWNLTSVEAGAMSSYGLFGMTFGAILFGILADRVGRKKMIVLAIIEFSLFTFLCGFAESPALFSIYRFLAGLGLGGIMPNVIALATDYAPRNRKSIMVSIVLCGYSIGGMIAPLLGILLMPSMGWEIIFWIAGAPILLIPILIKQLPESAGYLIRKGRTDELATTLLKVNPEYQLPENAVFVMAEKEEKIPVIGLFKESRLLSTIMFWIVFFMCLLMIFGLNTWLPNLMMSAGYGLNSSLAFLIALQVGAIVGTLIIGGLCDRYGAKKMLVPLYLLGAVGLTLLGFGGPTFYIYILVGITGACTVGAQNLIQAYVSQYYPPHMRSTALGVASGIGRFGGMVGPIMGGILLTIELPIYYYFIAFAIPGLLAALALSLVSTKKAYHSVQDQQVKRKTIGNQPAVSSH